jgi:uncharacterized membrane protein YbhN (UPF0104 family)
VIRRRAWWPWLKRALTFAFFAAVIGLLVHFARGVEWAEVKQGMLALPRHVLWQAAALCAASHLLYSCFDLLGRRYTGHGLAVPKVMQVNFVSYAFNLNLGSLVGGVAFRYRMYSRLGLPTATITRVLTLSMLTNWLGYLLLAGLAFTLAPLALPPDWKLDSEGLRLLGIALLAIAMTYVLLCFLRGGQGWTVRGHELILPKPRMALVQLAMSSANWMIMGAAVYTLLQGRIPYGDVLAVLLVAAVAGVITHVPAGLGVLEAVFVTLLSHRLPQSEILAALLGYRALYYIVPLAVAAALYLGLELRARRRPAAARPS